MATKTDKGVALSNEASEAVTQEIPAKDASALMKAVNAAEPPEIAADDPKDSGAMQLSLSQESLDAMTKELREALHQIANGFGELTAPGIIFGMDQPFYVIDAFTIDDYVDQTTGEEKTKHVFRLEFGDGVVRSVMQSDARPRRVLAKAFMLATGLGGRLKVGPYKFDKKAIPRQIQPAFIFSPQPGFEQIAY